MDETGFCLEEMIRWGEHFDLRLETPNREVVSVWLARHLLKVRDRSGGISALNANPAQAKFERDRGLQNIVVKARQMGITSWVAGRFLKTICARGVLTVQVAHTREAAEGIFRMVQRFWERLPKGMREGYLRRSRANVGQMVFPWTGQRIPRAERFG